MANDRIQKSWTIRFDRKIGPVVVNGVDRDHLTEAKKQAMQIINRGIPKPQGVKIVDCSYVEIHLGPMLANSKKDPRRSR